MVGAQPKPCCNPHHLYSKEAGHPVLMNAHQDTHSPVLKSPLPNSFVASQWASHPTQTNAPTHPLHLDLLDSKHHLFSGVTTTKFVKGKLSKRNNKNLETHPHRIYGIGIYICLELVYFYGITSGKYMKTMSVRQGPWDLGGGVELFQWDKSVGETSEGRRSTPCSQRIHVWYIYLHGWLIFMVNVG